MRWLPTVLSALLLAGCQIGGQAGGQAPSRPSPSPSPTPLVALRPPAQAILGDADVGLRREAGTAHLSLEEAAAAAPDQVVALQEFRGWGWADAAQQRWAAPGAAVTDLVLLTDREDGARRAFAYLAQQAAAPPLAAGPCPSAVAGLDDCTLGTAGQRTVVVGRLAQELFVLDVSGRDAVPLAAAQAARLRAT